MKTWKRALALVLALVMALSLVALPSFAAGEDEKDTYDVIINYVFANDQSKQAADPWTATVKKGDTLNVTVTSPAVVGYTPSQAQVTFNKAINKDTTVTVTYTPAIVNFTVVHYQQNVNDDNYTQAETEKKTGQTDDYVGASLAKTYDGFYALPYENVRIAADGSTVVEVYYDRNYYLMDFTMNGGYGVEPIYARYGTPIASVGTPVRAGYTFASWTPDLTLPATMPAQNTTYAANWTAGQSTYLVQYWLENANDDGYSYDTSVKKTASTGSKVSGSNDKSYTGFHFDRANQNVEVKGDGSTVVNVYYNRDTYTLTFKVDEGIVFSNWKTKAEFKNIKYGADTSTWWSQAPSGYLWYTTSDGNTFYTAAPDMPNRNLVIYGKTSSGSSTVHYYEVDTTNRVRPDLKIGTSGWEFTTEDYIKIPGFTYASSDGDNLGNNYYIYYSRNSYNLDFNNNGTIVKSEKVPYEKALVEYKFVPEYPSGLEENAYTFDGWYTDPGCTVAVDWDNATMPYNNTILYAKWAPKTHTVRTYLNEEAMNNNQQLGETQTVAHRAQATEPTLPKTELQFVSWFYKDENGNEHAFNFSMAVTRDLNLYAKWSSTILKTYTVHYVLASDGVTKIADDTTGSALVGNTKTFYAKGDTDLYPDYRAGFYPDAVSKSLTVSADGTNEITFYYEDAGVVPYTVKYLDKATNEPLRDEKVVDNNRKAVVTEKALTISGYVADEYQKTLVVTKNGENVITFWYTRDEAHAIVYYAHHVRNIDGTGYDLYTEGSYKGDVGTYL